MHLEFFFSDPSDPIIDKHLSEPWYMVLFQMSRNLMNMEDQMLTFSSDGRILTYKIKVDGVHLHASSMLRVPRSDSDVNQMTITRELKGREHLILGSIEKLAMICGNQLTSSAFLQGLSHFLQCL